MIAASPTRVSGIFGAPPFPARQAQPRPMEPAGQPFRPAPASPPQGVFGANSLVATPEQEAETERLSQMYPDAGPLGGSMRQPFDYAAAMAALAGNQAQPSRSQMIAGTVGDMLAGASGGQATFLPSLQAQRQAQSHRLDAANRQVLDWQQADWARQNAADLNAAAPFTIGRSRLQFDPASGQTDALYTGPEDFDHYAERLGLQPGTEDYYNAVEDYVLRANGPSAFDRYVQLDDHRTGNDIRVEGVRQSNRVGLEDHRQGNRIELRGIPQARSAPAPRSRRSGGAGGSDRIPTVRNRAEASRLPPGTQFRTPEGRTMRVPAN